MTREALAPFRILTTADQEASAPKAWVVRGLLGAGEVSGLVAPPTVGKSALSLDLAATVAAGADWFGRKTTSGAALYFAPERGLVTLRRLRAFEVFHEVGRLNVGVVRDRLDLMGPRDAGRILDAVRAFEDRTGAAVRFLTVDTARAAMPGGDENSPRDMGALAQNIGRVRDGLPAAHIQLIHHTPKGRPAEASGHTALTAMMDAVLVVAVAKGEQRSWMIAEANDLPELPPRCLFELRPVVIGRDALGADLTAPVVVPLEIGGPVNRASGDRLPKDAELALDALTSLINGADTISIEEWRPAAYRAFNDRKPRDGDAQRQAFITAKKRLADEGYIAVNDDTVSVRKRENA
jgi:putative DNA primase/helicase